MHDWDTYEIETALCSSALSSSSWSNLVLIMEVDVNEDSSSLTCYINGSSYSETVISSSYLQDILTEFSVSIGALKSSDTNYSSFYHGFLYSLKFWNKAFYPSDMMNNCSGTCTYCPTTGECLP